MTNFDWMKDASCAGQTALFFSRDGEKAHERRQRERRAVVVCLSCPVMHECRAYARENNELGVWGGETEEQRYQLGYLSDVFIRRKFRERDRRKLRKEATKISASLVSEDA